MTSRRPGLPPLALSLLLGCASSVADPSPKPAPPPRARGILSFGDSGSCAVNGRVLSLGDSGSAVEGWLEPRPAPALVRIECSIDRSKETGSLVIEDAQRNLRLKLLYWGSFEYTWRDRSANVKRFEIRWNDGDVTREGWGALGMVDSLRMDASGRVRLAFTIHEFDLTSPLRGCDMDPKRLGVTWVEIEHCTFQ